MREFITELTLKMPTLTVFKVGGSLQPNPISSSDPTEASLLESAPDQSPSPQPLKRVEDICSELGDRILIVSGGGPGADIVRHWDRVLKVGEAASHPIAIHAMGLGARLIASCLGNAALTRSLAECQQVWDAGKIAVADPQPMIDELLDQGAPPIPLNWQFTSDSIAAWLAQGMNADRLVFGKSIDLQEARRRSDAIDEAVSSMHGLPDLLWCNMRGGSVFLEPFQLPL
jgi:aspartokinase-like uncharacterized kinase